MKAYRLAEMLLRNPDAEVYVQATDSEYACPVNGSPKVRMDDETSEGGRPVKVLIFNYWETDYLRVSELRRTGDKKREPSVRVTSKHTGRTLS